MSSEPFNKQLRKATREIHSISDALVNAKLTFALSNEAVWSEGLLVFYEIFRYLEQAMERLKDTQVGQMRIPGMNRTQAFEQDLEFYLGSDWKQKYTCRPSVANYLVHLTQIENTQPILLVAYIYHLYMGLFSGGQILRKKRLLANKFWPFGNRKTTSAEGNAVTDFGDIPISKLKHDMVNQVNALARELDKDTQQQLLEESKRVFELNNEIISSVQGVNKVLIWKTLSFSLLAVIILAVFVAYYKNQ